MNISDRSKNTALRIVSGLVSPGGVRGKLLILCYHRVLPATDPLIPDGINRSEFDMHMGVVARLFCPLPLNKAVEKLTIGSLPPRAICITFDDGYADNLEIALPVLQKYEIPATVFIASDYLDGGRMWNDTITESLRRAKGDALDLSDFGLPGMTSIATERERGKAALTSMMHIRRYPPPQRALLVEKLVKKIGVELPDNLMLSSEQVLELHAAGIEIGAHTMSHPILSRLTADSAEHEIRGSREKLQELTGANIPGFAYPNGQPEVDFDKSHVQTTTRAGFSYAVSTAHGCASTGADLFQLPRMSPWDRTPARLAMRLIRECTLAPAQIAV